MIQRLIQSWIYLCPLIKHFIFHTFNIQYLSFLLFCFMKPLTSWLANGIKTDKNNTEIRIMLDWPDKTSWTHLGQGCSCIYSSQSGHRLCYGSCCCGVSFLCPQFYSLVLLIEKSRNPAGFVRAWISCACITCSKKQPDIWKREIERKGGR